MEKQYDNDLMWLVYAISPSSTDPKEQTGDATEDVSETEVQTIRQLALPVSTNPNKEVSHDLVGISDPPVSLEANEINETTVGIYL